MAKADRKHFGAGARDKGKGDGTGAMSELGEAQLPAGGVLSNRDKAQHSDGRGLDSKHVQTEQYQDHAANRRPRDEPEESDRE